MTDSHKSRHSGNGDEGNDARSNRGKRRSESIRDRVLSDTSSAELNRAGPSRDKQDSATAHELVVDRPVVMDAMAHDFPRIPTESTVREAVETFLRAGWQAGIVLTPQGGPAGVIGRQEILGALSRRTGGFFSEQEIAFGMVPPGAFDSEALRDVWRRLWEAPVATVMQRDIPSVRDTESLAVAAGRMVGESTHIVVVTKGGRVVGALRPSDILDSLRRTPEPVRRKPHPHRKRSRR